MIPKFISPIMTCLWTPDSGIQQSFNIPDWISSTHQILDLTQNCFSHCLPNLTWWQFHIFRRRGSQSMNLGVVLNVPFSHTSHLPSTKAFSFMLIPTSDPLTPFTVPPVFKPLLSHLLVLFQELVSLLIYFTLHLTPSQYNTRARMFHFTCFQLPALPSLNNKSKKIPTKQKKTQTPLKSVT